MRNEWSIARIRLTETRKVFEYEHSFTNFDFLTDDTIIFDKDSCVFATVYSINDNCEIPIIHSIISKSSNLPDARFCRSREIDLYYNNKSLEYPSHLFVEYELSSNYCKEVIQVMIDPSTLQPISPAYSTLRGKYVQLSDDFTIKKLFSEDNNYLKVIDAFLYELYYTNTRKTEAEFCTDIENF